MHRRLTHAGRLDARGIKASVGEASGSVSLYGDLAAGSAEGRDGRGEMILAVLFANTDGNILIERYARRLPLQSRLP